MQPAQQVSVNTEQDRKAEDASKNCLAKNL